MREPQARPMQFYTDEEGTLHTDPMMTDKIMTRAWAEENKGTDKTAKTSGHYTHKTCVYIQQEHNITDITTQQLRRLQQRQEERDKTRRLGTMSRSVV